jgi:hypothetical protein
MFLMMRVRQFFLETSFLVHRCWETKVGVSISQQVTWCSNNFYFCSGVVTMRYALLLVVTL